MISSNNNLCLLQIISMDKGQHFEEDFAPPLAVGPGVSGKVITSVHEQVYLVGCLETGKSNTVIWLEPHQLKLEPVMKIVKRIRFGDVFRFIDWTDLSVSALNGRPVF